VKRPASPIAELLLDPEERVKLAIKLLEVDPPRLLTYTERERIAAELLDRNAAQDGRHRAGVKAARRNQKKSADRQKLLGDWVCDPRRASLSIGQLHAKLSTMTPEDRHTQTGSRDVPSKSTIGRSRRNRVR
jgi:hypothetical protein